MPAHRLALENFPRKNNGLPYYCYEKEYTGFAPLRPSVAVRSGKWPTRMGHLHGRNGANGPMVNFPPFVQE